VSGGGKGDRRKLAIIIQEKRLKEKMFIIMRAIEERSQESGY